MKWTDIDQIKIFSKFSQMISQKDPEHSQHHQESLSKEDEGPFPPLLPVEWLRTGLHDCRNVQKHSYITWIISVQNEECTH